MDNKKFSGLLEGRTLEEQDDIQDILKKIEEYGEDTVPPKNTKVIESRRPPKILYYLDIAKAVSARSTCLTRHYGCVIVKNDEIIATGYNGNPRGELNCCDVGRCSRNPLKQHNSGDYSDCGSVHAEQNAMLSAARKDMIGADMYLYGEAYCEDYGEVYQLEATPCPICARMIKNAGIGHIYNKSGIIIM